MPHHPHGEAESVAPRYSSPQPPGPVAGLPKDPIYGGHPVHLEVPLVPEDDLGAAINHTIRPGWSSPASLVHIRQVRHRDDQLRVKCRGERGCVVHRTQRRVRAIGADHQGLIGAHFPCIPSAVSSTERPAGSRERRICQFHTAPCTSPNKMLQLISTVSPATRRAQVWRPCRPVPRAVWAWRHLFAAPWYNTELGLVGRP